MPSFDIVSKVDIQKLDNAINAAKKEIVSRYDFNDSKTTMELDKKTMVIQVVTENDMRMKTIESIIIGRMVKQGLDAGSLDFGKELYAAGNMDFGRRKSPGLTRTRSRKRLRSIAPL